MPVFYFDTDDGQISLQDLYGLELAGIDEARSLALKTLPHLAIETPPDSRLSNMSVTVRDDNGGLVLTATISIAVVWS